MKVINIKSEEHLNQIISNTGQEKHNCKYVLVDFYATWCGPCKKMSKIIEEQCEKYHKYIHFVKVDVDKVVDLSDKYNVISLPTFLFFKVGCTKKLNYDIVGANNTKLIDTCKNYSKNVL